ncbi:MAG: choice-of-anchor B domain-containing protein [Enterobacterales bacterium]|jgi:choice-of-anchor B domain-containing protein
MNTLKLSTRLIAILKVGLVFLLVQSIQISAHGTKHPSRYIATDGQDTGDCTNSQRPCASIAYAVGLSSKGDQILVAEGEYSSAGMDAFYLLSGLVKIQAGYSKNDNFHKQDSLKNPTTFYGVPPEYRETMQAMGFKVITDSKANEIKLSKTELDLLNNFQQLNSSSQTVTECTNGFAAEFECDGLLLQSRVPSSLLNSASPSLNDIWGFVDLNDDKEYAIVGLTNGTAVVDVSDPANPITKGHVSGLSSTWRDMKVYQSWNAALNRYQSYAYVTTEAGQGLQIIDLTDLPSSISLASTLTDFTRAHNIYIANIDYSTGVANEGMTAYIYVAGTNLSNGAFRVYDLVDPTAPVLVTSAPTGSGYVHDVTTFTITDQRTAQCAAGHNPCELLVDFNEKTVDIWDMTDKIAPTIISSTGYANSGYTHSGWWSEDKMFIFIQDELDERDTGSNTTLRTLDISDLTAPFVSNIHTGPTQAIDHNGFAVGNKYYMSNYRRGLTVYDITDPNQPLITGFFDTYPQPSENTASFAGAWGVYPFLPSGNILISDSSYGLFVVKEAENSTTPPVTPPVTPPTTPTNNGGNGGGSTGLPLLVLAVGLLLYRRRITLLKA